MIKHVGKHGERKIVVVFNEVPGEPHMCIAVYPDLLQRQMHDDLMKAIESIEAQNAENLGDALASKYFHDGTVMLNRLHSENIMKKVQTSAVVLTPTPQSHVRLDEMNKILNEMKSGQEAVDRLQEIENSRGMAATGLPRDAEGRRVDDKGMDIGGPGPNVPMPGALNESSHQGAVSAASIAATMAAPATGALDDAAIANNLKIQADKMAQEAQGMLAESARMQAEANAMLGIKEKPAKKKRGRPAKAPA